MPPSLSARLLADTDHLTQSHQGTKKSTSLHAISALRVQLPLPDSQEFGSQPNSLNSCESSYTILKSDPCHLTPNLSRPAIIVENLSKKFRIGTSGGPGYHRLSEMLTGLPRYAYNQFFPRRVPDSGSPRTATSAPATEYSGSPRPVSGRGAGGEGLAPESSSSPLPPPATSLPPTSDFWALRDVSFEVQPGEVVGIIGRNGAGKSTLLKILSRITEPTSGRFGVRGRIASLLEVGTGFHPELTGRENIYVSGITLGMTRAEIKKRFDEIVDFSGVEKFLDTPVKRYSSGMQVRLGFAVAAHLESEILIVDEVLAVGDAEFQKKCLGKMDDVAQSGRTVLLVSHNIQNISSLSTKAVHLESGRAHDVGDARDVCKAYMQSLASGTQSQRRLHDELTIDRVRLLNSLGEATDYFNPGSELTVEVECTAHRRIERPHFYVAIRSIHGSAFGGNMILDGHCPKFIDGSACLLCTFPNIPLLPQDYTVGIGVRRVDGEYFVATLDPAAQFTVLGPLSEYGLHGRIAERLLDGCIPVMVPYRWTLPDGEQVSVSLHAKA